jgi:hypothetical protein
MIRAPFLMIVPLLLAACDPQAVVDGTVRRTAGEVVQAVVGKEMPAAPAAAATECILQAATTKENIRNLAMRPATQACFAAAGVPQVL